MFPSSPAHSSHSLPSSESSFAMGHISKLTNSLLPLPPLQQAASESSFCDVPCFRAHQPIPPSSSPPGCESSFVTCHVSRLTNTLLPLPPLQDVSLCL